MSGNDSKFRKSMMTLDLLAKVITVLAATIALVGGLLQISSMISPDFELEIDPQNGTAYPGDYPPMTNITISAANLLGYDELVRLNASSPRGIVVSFSAKYGRPEPDFTSTATMLVTDDIFPDEYPIVITARGADGKMHGKEYILDCNPGNAAVNASLFNIT